MSGSSTFHKALQAIESKLDALLQERRQLLQENRTLRQTEQDWQLERAKLVEKNELARTRVEAMIARLKSLETDA